MIGRTSTDPLIQVREMVVEYGRSKQRVRAVAGVNFDVQRGETLGIVGESGCGKSSTARALLQLPGPTAGSVRLDGVELTDLSSRELRRMRRRIQVVLQDPISCLNPRRKVRDIVAEGLHIWDVDDVDTRVEQVMAAVGLDATVIGDRLPSEFSGGQCQRISIARALALRPEVLICDEPVSALDVSVQAQIINLLMDLKASFGLTMVFVSHDLSVVKLISDRVAVMYLGVLCEIAPVEELFEDPKHPYTQMLLSAVPVRDPEAPVPERAVVGDVPSIANPPSGCRFRTRCPQAQDVCAEQEPLMRPVGADRQVACHFVD